MDLGFVSSAFGLVAQASLPFIVAAAGAALIVGMFQVATQLSDDAIAFAARFGAIALALFIFGGSVSTEILQFAQRMWSEVETYQ